MAGQKVKVLLENNKREREPGWRIVREVRIEILSSVACRVY